MNETMLLNDTYDLLWVALLITMNKVLITH